MSGDDLQARPPQECANMMQLRAEIDRIDGLLVKLLARRQRYIERAAEIKPERAAVRDPARIQDVLNKVAAAASAQNLDPAIAEAVFKILIECSIALEFKTFDRRCRSKTPG